MENHRTTDICLSNPQQLYGYFRTAKVVKPDKVCRPHGDTTFFTSAGIQHIETLMKEKDGLEKSQFVIAQPIIRSQFINRVKLGISTSFNNFSVCSIRATQQDYVDFRDIFTQLVVDQGVNTKKICFTMHEEPDKWGERRFTKSVWTLFLDNVELGECVYIKDYPVNDLDRAEIVDLGFGIERLNWSLGRNPFYFPDSDKYFEQISPNYRDKVPSIIDSMRSMVLIAGDGVKPSQHDHGYRLRLFSKKFVRDNIEVGLPMKDLLAYAYSSWEKWGYEFDQNEGAVASVIMVENERNFNGLFLEKLRLNRGINVKVNINQPTEDFLNQMEFSVSRDIISNILGVIYE